MMEYPQSLIKISEFKHESCMSLITQDVSEIISNNFDSLKHDTVTRT